MVVHWVNMIVLRVPEYGTSARVLDLCIDRSSRPDAARVGVGGARRAVGVGGARGIEAR